MVIQRFACKETQAILGLSSPTKATQAMEPAWEKVARHAEADFARTVATILWHIEQRRGSDEAKRRTG